MGEHLIRFKSHDSKRESCNFNNNVSIYLPGGLAISILSTSYRFAFSLMVSETQFFWLFCQICRLFSGTALLPTHPGSPLLDFGSHRVAFVLNAGGPHLYFESTRLLLPFVLGGAHINCVLPSEWTNTCSTGFLLDFLHYYWHLLTIVSRFVPFLGLLHKWLLPLHLLFSIWPRLVLLRLACYESLVE